LIPSPVPATHAHLARSAPFDASAANGWNSPRACARRRVPLPASSFDAVGGAARAGESVRYGMGAACLLLSRGSMFVKAALKAAEREEAQRIPKCSLLFMCTLSPLYQIVPEIPMSFHTETPFPAICKCT
jgi:hypothetical protein